MPPPSAPRRAVRLLAGAAAAAVATASVLGWAAPPAAGASTAVAARPAAQTPSRPAWCTDSPASTVRLVFPGCAGEAGLLAHHTIRPDLAGPSGTALTVTGTGPNGCAGTTVAANCPLWHAGHTNPAADGDACEGYDQPLAMAAHGAAVYVTGLSCVERADGVLHADVETVAYDGATGRELWVSRYDGPLHGNDAAFAVSVTPDGATVIVAGITDQAPVFPDNVFSGDYLTIAYDAVSGAQRWLATYTSPETGRGANPVNPPDLATALTTSDDGQRVYVTGASFRLSPFPYQYDFATLSYDVSTGARDWVDTYSSPSCDGDTYDIPLSIATRGERIYVAAYAGSTHCASNENTHLIVLDDDRDLHQARRVWAHGLPDVSPAPDLAVTDSAVVVAGHARGTCPDGTFPRRYVTVALDPADGVQRWRSDYAGPPELRDGLCGHSTPAAMAASPDGDTVYVTGTVNRASVPAPITDDSVSATVAYRTSDGTQRWVAVSDLPAVGADEIVQDLSVSPAGDQVYLAGYVTYRVPLTDPVLKADFLTVALRSADGARIWADRYNDSAFAGSTDLDVGRLSAVSPDGSRVFTSGQFIHDVSTTGTNFYDFGTVAYSAYPLGSGEPPPVVPEGSPLALVVVAAAAIAGSAAMQRRRRSGSVG